jgi:adenylate kinase
MLRAATRSGADFGNKAAEYMHAGELVPDDVMIEVVRHRLDQHDTKNRGFILDGFPRTVAQSEALEEILEPEGLDLVLDLEVPTDIVLERLASRRVCGVCQANYGLDTPPHYEGICDHCGGELSQRDDDTEEAIRRRLELYESATAPLIEWYLTRDKLAAVDGYGPADRVAARLIRAIDNRRQRTY